MHKRPLGKTGFNVGVVGLGTVKLGRAEDVKYPHPFTIPDDRTAARLLDAAWELGVNFLDTAPAYGDSEARLGRLLKKSPRDWVLCTKAGEEWQGESRHDFSPAALRASVERSLRRLNRDCMDVVLLHCQRPDAAVVEDGLGVLLQLKKEGLLRAAGASTKSARDAEVAAADADVLMSCYRPDYQDEASALDLCRERGVGVLIKKALSSGHATDIGGNLHFALSHPAVASVIVGTIDADHLRDNVENLGND